MRLVGSILQEKPGEKINSHEIRERLGVREDQRLIYAGISGPRAEREPLIRLLEPIFAGFPDKYRVLMSMGTPNGGSDPTENGALTVIPWLENRFEYLNACDLVISRGGHETIMQSICYGKPAVIIPVPRHPEQYGNARRAMELGVATAIHQRDIDRDSLVALLDRMMGSSRYRWVLDDINSKEHLGDGLENTLEVINETLRR